MENQNFTSTLSEYVQDKKIILPNELPQSISEIVVDLEKVEKWSTK